jgi:hypothetical protein
MCPLSQFDVVLIHDERRDLLFHRADRDAIGKTIVEWMTRPRYGVRWLTGEQSGVKWRKIAAGVGGSGHEVGRGDVSWHPRTSP